MRKRIVGEKISHIEAITITNPNNGKLVVSKDKIKQITLQYCNNILDMEYLNLVEDKRIEMNRRLLKLDGCFAPQSDTFEFF